MNENIWLAADYHFPSLYSIKDPSSSPSFAKAMPGPGPATVRLALVNVGILVFGVNYIRNELFEVIKLAKILVSPPNKVAITSHLIRGMKPNEDKTSFYSSMITREYAHTFDLLSIYLLLPEKYIYPVGIILKRIGYWGEAESITFCTKLENRSPNLSFCAIPLQNYNKNKRIGNFFLSSSSEFKENAIN